ncbi:MFS transporter [Deinococcus yavapaiensis]|nr:MFS transporter [Deinococcus yavapaiensis]
MTVSPRAALTSILVFVLIGATQALYGPALPSLSRQFGVSVSTAGLLISAHSLGALLGVLSAVPLQGRPFARWRAGVAVALLGVGAALLAVASSWSAALLAALLIGLGYGAITVGLNSLFAAGFGPRSAAMVNLLNALFGVGAVLGPLVVAAAPANARLPFVVIAASALLLLPFAVALDDRVASAPNTSRPRSPKGPLVGFIMLLALGVGVEASSIGWNATYLVSLGKTPQAAASFTALFFVLFTLGRLAAVPLSLRFAPPILVLVALTLAMGLLLVAHVPSAAPYALVALGGALAAVFPNTFTWASRAVQARQDATAVIVAGALLGSTIFPAVVGRAVALFGERAIPTTLATLAALTLTMALWMRWRTR